jgi:hypothetical protein
MTIVPAPQIGFYETNVNPYFNTGLILIYVVLLFTKKPSSIKNFTPGEGVIG